MAVVRFYRTMPLAVNGNLAPVAGWLRFTPTARRVIVGDPDNTVLPIESSVNLENGAASADLAATGTGWVWKIEEFINKKPGDLSSAPDKTYYVAVPTGAGPIDDPDLVRVNPGDYTPIDTTKNVSLAGLDSRVTTLEAGGGGSTPDATSSVKGKVKLAGDLGGTADAPTVPGLAGKVSTTDPRLSDARTPTAHTHNASDVNAGVLNVARLGSGTPAAGKYVDGGTGAWTALPTGGGGASSYAGAPQSGGYMVYPSGDVSTLSLFGFTYFVPMFLPASLSLQEVAVEVTTAAATSVLKIGYYTLDATGTLNLGAAFSTTLDGSTTGIKAATGSWTLPAGVVWLGIGWTGAGCTVRAASRVDLPGPIFTPNATTGMQSAANLIRGGGQIGDATITPSTDGSVAAPKFRLRKA